MGGCTTAVRDDTSFAHFIFAHFFHEAQYGVECAPHFERTDALQILTFEEQSDLRLCRLLSLPLRSLERFGGLRGRCEGGEGRVCEDGGSVDVGFDDCVGRHYRLTRQGTGRCISSHGTRGLRSGVVIVGSSVVIIRRRQDAGAWGRWDESCT
jgi:hypothetical protein